MTNSRSSCYNKKAGFAYTIEEYYMNYVYIILEILGGMGALLIGMKLLSENLTKLAHKPLKRRRTVLPAWGSVRRSQYSDKVLHSPPSWS